MSMGALMVVGEPREPGGTSRLAVKRRPLDMTVSNRCIFAGMARQDKIDHKRSMNSFSVIETKEYSSSRKTLQRFLEHLLSLATASQFGAKKMQARRRGY